MTGERRAWFRVASHLSVPVRELQDRITYGEFIDWLTFLALEERQDTKQDYYLAQIAAEVRRGNVKKPKTVKTTDLLLKFKETEASPAAQKTAKSKSAWAGALHLKLEDP